MTNTIHVCAGGAVGDGGRLPVVHGRPAARLPVRGGALPHPAPRRRDPLHR